MTDDTRTMRFDAQDLASAWLGVFAATSDDPDMMSLYRTVNLGVADQGIRLTSTNGALLLTSDTPAVGFRKVPKRIGETITAYDGDHRGRDLLKYAYRTVTAKDALREEIELTVGTFPTEDGQFAGLEMRGVTLTFPAAKEPRESVSLRLLDSSFPDVASLLDLRREPLAIDRISLNPVYLGLLAATQRYWPNAIEFTFSGESTMVGLHTRRHDPDRVMTGAIIPTRTLDPQADPSTGEMT